MTNRLVALSNRVIVIPRDVTGEVKTKSGLFVPDITSNRPASGTVTSIGHKLSKMQLAVGDTLLYIKGRGHEMVIDNEAHLILEKKDILAKIV